MHDDPPSILSLAVVEAPHPASQSDLEGLVLELFASAPLDLEALRRVFDNAGIRRRTLALPVHAYRETLTPGTRNRHFLDVGSRMLLAAAERSVPPHLRSEVTHVVTVCTTGIATPSLECGLIDALGLGGQVRRVPLFGLGCAGGAAGLQVARDLAASDPDALVLLLCLELTSLTLLREDQSQRNFIACALFGDGAAAALLGRQRDGLRPIARIGRGATRLFRDTRDLMGWDVVDAGWRVVFSSRIPSIVRTEIAELVTAVTPRDSLRHFALHPGGRRILEAYEEALGLGACELEAPRAVLAEFGNMSAASVFFVLDHILRAPDFRPGPGIMTAFGPGFSAEVLALDLVGPARPSPSAGSSEAPSLLS